jgi:hypothetical protein
VQDVVEDMKNNHRTIFTQSIAEGETLDAPTARLIHYHLYAPAYAKPADDDRTVSGDRSRVALIQYIRASMMMFSLALILEAASRLPQYYSKEFHRELATLSPLTFDDLSVARLEDKIWSIIRSQWF